MLNLFGLLFHFNRFKLLGVFNAIAKPIDRFNIFFLTCLKKYFTIDVSDVIGKGVYVYFLIEVLKDYH
jgi:hypothetical protein